MHGNVGELCADWYGADYYGQSPKNDPSGPPTGSRRVDRGGNWRDGAKHCRSAYRDWFLPSSRYGSLGFRPAFSLP